VFEVFRCHWNRSLPGTAVLENGGPWILLGYMMWGLFAMLLGPPLPNSPDLEPDIDF